MDDRQFQFEWDEVKAAINVRKHGVSFELAATVFADPGLLSVADVEHSDQEDRWFSIGWASNGAMLSVVYLYHGDSSPVRIRIISARPATASEIRQYREMP